MEEVPNEIKIKIIQKIYGMAFIRSLEKNDTKITIPEFKYIITRYSVKKKQWFKLAKELEKDGVIKLHGGNPIEVLRSNINIQT